MSSIDPLTLSNNTQDFVRLGTFERYGDETCRWGFIKEYASECRFFFHQSCLKFPKTQLNNSAIFGFKIGISSKTGKISCTEISFLDDYLFDLEGRMKQIKTELIQRGVKFTDNYGNYIPVYLIQ